MAPNMTPSTVLYIWLVMAPYIIPCVVSKLFPGSARTHPRWYRSVSFLLLFAAYLPVCYLYERGKLVDHITQSSLTRNATFCHAWDSVTPYIKPIHWFALYAILVHCIVHLIAALLFDDDVLEQSLWHVWLVDYTIYMLIFVPFMHLIFRKAKHRQEPFMICGWEYQL